MERKLKREFLCKQNPIMFNNVCDNIKMKLHHVGNCYFLICGKLFVSGIVKLSKLFLDIS